MSLDLLNEEPYHPDVKLKLTPRQLKVIALRVRGWTYEEIGRELGVNERTVRRDIKSAPIQEFIDELVRRQLQDLDSDEVDISLRLKYRDLLIEKLLSRRNASGSGEGIRLTIEAWRPSSEQAAPKRVRAESKDAEGDA